MTRHRQGRARGPWTDEAILRESERWVHIPPSGVLVEDAKRLLVHPPASRGTSRVWRSRPGLSGAAEALIVRTIEEVRAAGGTCLVWHTGDGVSPPSMDDLLLRYGFERTEDLDVLAFELGVDPEPRLPGLPIPAGVGTRLVRDEADLRRANGVEAEILKGTTRDEQDTRAYLQGISKLEGRGRRERPGPQDDSLVLRYLACIQASGGEKGETVATAGAEVVGETVRLWGAGTRAEHRGRGAYRALVIDRCRHAHALGVTLALAKANTASSAPILRTAGFRAVARERRYVLKVSALTRPRAPRVNGHL